jgi:hypothetical protein
MKVEVFLFTVTLALTACGGGPSSPTPPSSTAPPQPAPTATLPGVTNWLVTQRFASVTGPDNCWIREQRQTWTGAVFPDLDMVITLSGSSIKLDSGWFAVNYAGTSAGSDFSASGTAALEGGGRPCRDGSSFTQMPGTSRLTGSFSGNGQALTATEVNSYRLTSGEEVTYTWEWQATRRN